MEIIHALSTDIMIGHSLYKSIDDIYTTNKSKLFSYEIDCELIDENLLDDLIFEKDLNDDTKPKRSEWEDDDYEIEYDKLIFDDEDKNSSKDTDIKEEKSSSACKEDHEAEDEDDILANVDVKEFNNLIFDLSQKEYENSDTNSNTRMTLLSNADSPKKTKEEKSKNSFTDFFKILKKKGKGKLSPASSPTKDSQTSGDSTSINMPSNNTPSFLKRKRKLQKENQKTFSLEEKNGETFLNISNAFANPINTEISPCSAFPACSTFTSTSSTVSIVSYNILNQIYMKKSGREDLSLQNRIKTIILELKNLNADIICLQEADLNVLKTYLIKSFPEYNLVYGVNCGSSFINVVGYKKEKFRLISFKNFSLLNYKVVGNRGAMNVILERNSQNKENISVYNVHFPWRHEMQRCEILEMLYNNIEENNLDNVVIAGDFNSEPYSIPIKLIYYDDYLKENLSVRDEKEFNLKKFWKEERFVLFENVYRRLGIKSAYENYKKYLKICKDEMRFNRSASKRGCQMDSSGKKSYNSSSAKKRLRLKFRNGKKICAKLNFNNYSTNQLDKFNSNKRLDKKNFKHHPDITTCTAFYSNTIDYIFHSRNLKLTKILKLPELNQIREEEFLPSVKYPSDHLKIFAQFELL